MTASCVAVSLEHPSLGALRVVSCHLDSGKSKGKYVESLDLLRSCLVGLNDSSVVIGVDANAFLGGFSHLNDRIGPHTVGVGGWKGRLFKDFLDEFDLIVVQKVILKWDV